MEKWLSIIGIGEDGLTGLSAAALALVNQAEILVGGARHLEFVPPRPGQTRWNWASPIRQTLEQICQQRGRAVCVLASGDPLWYGIGTTLLRQVPIAEVTLIPAVSALSLAASRLGWTLTEVDTLSLCGRDPAHLHRWLYPGAKLLVLSADRQTPSTVANLLVNRGWGASHLTVLAHLGGAQERLVMAPAVDWAERADLTPVADLNLVAIALPQDPTLTGTTHAFTPGLPDDAYHHDGQLTKREVRAVTLAALGPMPGQLLWDVGAGCGSIAIEWLRSHPRCGAIAIEQNPRRQQLIVDNAIALGTPHLQIVAGQAPAALADLPSPDTIFIGGGVTRPDLLTTCWNALRPGGRLVANAVTVESELKLFQAQQQWGGSLTRIAVQRASPIGSFLGWKAFSPITQWVGGKGAVGC
jgi:precorrin-6Y C5,15-methyltransferase (decarboxylating)